MKKETFKKIENKKREKTRTNIFTSIELEVAKENNNTHRYTHCTAIRFEINFVFSPTVDSIFAIVFSLWSFFLFFNISYFINFFKFWSCMKVFLENHMVLNLGICYSMLIVNQDQPDNINFNDTEITNNNDALIKNYTLPTISPYKISI